MQKIDKDIMGFIGTILVYARFGVLPARRWLVTLSLSAHTAVDISIFKYLSKFASKSIYRNSLQEYLSKFASKASIEILFESPLSNHATPGSPPGFTAESRFGSGPKISAEVTVRL